MDYIISLLIKYNNDLSKNNLDLTNAELIDTAFIDLYADYPLGDEDNCLNECKERAIKLFEKHIVLSDDDEIFLNQFIENLIITP